MNYEEIRKQFEQRIALLCEAEGAAQSYINTVLRKDENFMYTYSGMEHRFSDYLAGYQAALSNSNDISHAFDEFMEKTEFVQLNEYGLFRGCLGMHRADAMRHVIESQQTKIKELEAALASKQEDIKQGLDDIHLSMSMFANKEDYLKAVEEQEHIEQSR